jgi:hypothetical protein
MLRGSEAWYARRGSGRVGALVRWFVRDIVRVMPVDEDGSTAVTEELRRSQARRVRSDPGVFSGRARPVVMSALELALIDEADDPSTCRGWIWATDRGDVAGGGEGPVAVPDGQPLVLPDERRPSLASLMAHGAVVVILAIPVVLVVAFGIAVAAR